MKRTILPLLILAAVVLAAGSIFYWKNLRGIGPAITPPPADITKLISPAVNNTSFPLTLHDGFSISIYGRDLVNPRAMAIDPDGGLIVSIPSQGKVVALFDDNQDGIVDITLTLLEGLDRPHGLAFRCPPRDESQPRCDLYVAETNKIQVYEYNTASDMSRGRIIASLPSGSTHFSRTLLLSPDLNTLLVSVGSSCNVCHEKNDQRAKILSLNLTEENPQLTAFAVGLRNAVFMTVHPITKQIWATEMGRDLLGDDLPPDEINIIEQGKNYGWPICYGDNIHDTAFDKNTYIRNPCIEPFETPSHIDLPAHSAPLGLAFVPEAGWPKEYRGDLIVAFHGSWNRSVPTGYKLMRIKLNDEGDVQGIEDFISGWLTPQGALGRPAGVLFGRDNALYVSDDKAGVIYRVTHESTP